MKAKNLKYSNQYGSTIDLEYEHPTYGWIPFTASETDVEDTGRELYKKAIAGDFGKIKPYTEPKIPTEVLISIVKKQRDTLLSESDWTDTLSAKNRLGDKLYDKWQDYRQKLRDVTKQAGYPDKVEWPNKPE